MTYFKWTVDYCLFVFSRGRFVYKHVNVTTCHKGKMYTTLLSTYHIETLSTGILMTFIDFQCIYHTCPL